MRQRTLLIALAVAVLVAAAGIVVVLLPDEAGAQRQQQGFVVSFAAAESALGDDEAERREQIRDWARFGLAARLDVDTGGMRDAFFDTFPIRDNGFSDLARQPTGPGRALFHGDTLHLLVPRDDVNDKRTAGLLLDQHRTDTGSDPAQVQVHRYEIRDHTIVITDENPQSANDFRTRNGYITKKINDELDEFLSAAKHLSTLEIRDGEVHAGGWNWPGPDVTAQDITVLQRAYSRHEQPGFSLDPPKKIPTREDVRAVLKNVPQQTVDLLLDGQADAALVEAGVFDEVSSEKLKAAGLPTDRTDLWTMLNHITNHPLYNEARYDGGIAGTEVGMTLFYTDLIAKQWVDGVGDGVPTISGFVPDSNAATPPSHCETSAGEESGRLWFGQNDKAFSFNGDKASIGAQSTRLFSRSDGAEGEVEPSYAFGRGLRWWDEHYQSVADHEAQYARLDQIMRWSGALEWLASKGKRLPETEPATDLRFTDWYTRHQDLKERGDIRPVQPPSATQEAVLTKPSKAFKDCGFYHVRGGVSLGDGIARTGDGFRADLPEPVRRAGPKDETSALDNGNGKITEVTVAKREVVDKVERTINTADGTATVKTTASGRQVVPLGELKVMRTNVRQLATTLKADRARIDYRVDYQGNHLGTLVAEKTRSFISLSWAKGVVNRMVQALQPLQRGKSLNDNVFYSQRDANGQTQHRVGGKDDPWLTIGPDAPADTFTVRAGVPDGRGIVSHLLAGLNPRAPPTGEFMTLKPTRDGPPIAEFGNAPPTGTPIQVRTPDGRSSQLHVDGNQVTVATSDPLLGHNGEVEGAAMLSDIAHVLATRTETNGLLQAVRFGDIGAMIGRHEIFLSPPGHQWSTRVLEALGGKATMRVTDGKAIHVDQSSLHRVSTRKLTMSEVLNSPSTTIYLNESFRATLSTKDGPVAADALNQDMTVTVREVSADQQQAVPADVRVHRDAEWIRVDAPPRIGLPTSLNIVITLNSAAPSSSPATPNGPAARILLICHENDDARGCGD
ncbi:hypothetical protein [Lentzea aerocolonigenes]|uniref:hypothetical protein n=1 Tax=Lentzea aerocolonigenes TaxID=68170 RepID=UPI000AF6B0D8|nr:hypothetical protein [Lentzea aerocolonigenes]MCP2243675.1 hypothetical protein [Lentzea aerocolonigenes]